MRLFPVQLAQGVLREVLYGTGIRPSQAYRLTWSDWDPAHGTLRIAPGKTGVGRTLPVPDWLALRLREVRARRGVRRGRAEDHIVVGQRWRPYRDDSSTVGHIWREWLALAGLPEHYPDGTVLDRDAIRHTFAHRLKDAGVPVAQAMQLMGHTSERMLLQVYGQAKLSVSWTMPGPPRSDAEERASS